LVCASRPMAATRYCERKARNVERTRVAAAAAA